MAQNNPPDIQDLQSKLAQAKDLTAGIPKISASELSEDTLNLPEESSPTIDTANLIYGVPKEQIDSARQQLMDAANRIQSRLQQQSPMEQTPWALEMLLNNNPHYDPTGDILRTQHQLSLEDQARQLEGDKIGMSALEAQNKFLGEDQSNFLKSKEISANAALKNAEIRLAQQRADALANGGSAPAAVKLANEIAKARAAGDMQRVADLQAAAKLGIGFDTITPVSQPDAYAELDNQDLSEQGLPPRVAPKPVGEDYLKTLPPDMASIVKMIGDGNEKSSTILSRMPVPDKVRIMAAVAQYKPDYSANQMGAVKDFNTGKLGNTVRSLGVADSHLQTLSDLSDALDNGDVKIINSIGNKYASQTGNPAPTNFETAKNIVADEVTKAVIGAGGTGEDRDKAAQVINQANSPAQLKGAIATYRALIKGQTEGLRQQYQRSTGRNDFDSLLSTHASTPSDLPAGAIKIGTSVGKAVYQLPDGSHVMEQ